MAYNTYLELEALTLLYWKNRAYSIMIDKFFKKDLTTRKV